MHANLSICSAPVLPPCAVRLIGVVGGKKELRVFERSKLLPFAIGIKFDPRRRDEIEWCAACPRRCACVQT